MTKDVIIFESLQLENMINFRKYIFTINKKGASKLSDFPIKSVCVCLCGNCWLNAAYAHTARDLLAAKWVALDLVPEIGILV